MLESEFQIGNSGLDPERIYKGFRAVMPGTDFSPAGWSDGRIMGQGLMGTRGNPP